MNFNKIGDIFKK